MEAFQVVREALTPRELLNAWNIGFILSHFLLLGKAVRWTSSLRALFHVTAGFIGLFMLARSWLALVNHFVPEPYLVSQAPPKFVMGTDTGPG